MYTVGVLRLKETIETSAVAENSQTFFFTISIFYQRSEKCYIHTYIGSFVYIYKICYICKHAPTPCCCIYF